MARTDRRPRRRLDPDSRRAAILSAAREAFANHPYNEVTLSAISDEAEASASLLYRYFGSKEDLYAEVVRSSIEDLMARQATAVKELPSGAPVRDRIMAMIVVYLDHIASHPQSWALPIRQPGSEPPALAQLRARARRDQVENLSSLLNPGQQERHTYALWGYFGFLDAACLHWVESGCLKNDRWAVIDAALGALQGGLGDWAA